MNGQSARMQAVRYGLVGAVVYGCDIATFAVLMWLLPESHLLANIAAKACGAAVGFVMHRAFTFSWQQRDGLARQAASYLAVLAGNLVASTALLWLLVDAVGVNPWISKVLVDVAVIAAAFVAGRLWVFRPV